ncbi:leucine-rich repeat domain-containing protein [Inconstantimicrobium mannanitabidum]|uniref:Uncharacterized protein n=1 Tax=Inconstantimicrobium mannanitabidum TaxID=1604901 RepID=A0ACB5RFL2_9CLOT|nr:leucine-rich repeat domain-containing protein [Clostridium sp. TW13]GKX67875.1 hypothetical protein rsdtw13_31330 [Clostridium sp. TW13]
MLKKQLKTLNVMKALLILLLSVLIMVPSNVFASTTSKAKVSISNIADISKNVRMGDKYALPNTVTATMSNKTTKQVPVKWNAKVVNTNKAGKYSFVGTVQGYNKKVTLTLNVQKYIKSVGDINATVIVGDSYRLPSAVTAIMNDNSKQQVSIIWNKSIDTNKVGKCNFTGNVQGYSKKINAMITVKDIVITFKDENLKKLVLDEVRKSCDQTIIHRSDVLKVTKLSFQNEEINNITGLEHFVNLESLDLSENKISDISALKGLTKLQRLLLQDNKIKDISALKNMVKLETLDLNGSQVKDISPIKDLIQMKDLNAYGNQIRDISSLKGLTNLKRFILGSNPISDISVVRNFTKLQELNINAAEIKDISVLKGLKNLVGINICHNQIKDISPLKDLKNLEWIDFDNNQIANIDALRGLTKLNDISFDSNRICNIDALKGLTKLKDLCLSNNQIININVLGNLKSLTSLELNYNKIKDINILKKMTNLRGIAIKGNQVSYEDKIALVHALPKCIMSI